MRRVAPDNIIDLKPNEIFTFGSNFAGKHGKGAAKFALKFGAKYGQGRGLMGKTYGLPTKDHQIRTLSLPEIEREVILYLECATNHPELEFLTTEIGCGLAGYSHKEIGKLFDGKIIPSNVALPRRFWRYIKE